MFSTMPHIFDLSFILTFENKKTFGEFLDVKVTERGTTMSFGEAKRSRKGC